jgi:Ca2+-binding RTX toxin-like protein
MHAPLALASLVLVASGIPFAASAQVAVETCQGKQVTIVQEGSEVEGTDGDDVIHASALYNGINVHAGAGDDTVCFSSGSVTYSTVDGGTGDDSIEARSPTSDEGRLTLRDFEHLDVKTYYHLSGIELEWTETPSVLDGSVDASYYPDPRASARYLDNPTVYLKVGGDATTLRVDLRRGRVRLGDGLGFDLTGVDDIGMTAEKLRGFGNDNRNYFFLSGCDVVARGGDGNDRLWMRDRKGDRHCPGARLYGQHGRDKLRGSDRNDRLVGGADRDRADGGNGKDRCLAEKEFTCER